MFKTVVAVGGSLNSFSKKSLKNLKTKSMRAGSWFKVLKQIDRALLDLVIKVEVNIRNPKLLQILHILTAKLEEALQCHSFRFRLKKIGTRLAKQVSAIAQKIGNVSAATWAFDSSFAVFLGVMKVNR